MPFGRMGLGLGLSSKSGGGVTTPITRIEPYRQFGSSSINGHNAGVTTNANGIAVPAQWQGVTVFGRLLVTTLPGTSTAPATITNSAVDGRSPELISGDVVTAANASQLTGVDVLYYHGINETTASDTFGEIYALMKTAQDATVSGGAAHSIFLNVNRYQSMSNSDRIMYDRVAWAMAKTTYERDNPAISWGDYGRPGVLWTATDVFTHTTEDALDQQEGLTASSLASSDRVHPNGYGYAVLSDGAILPSIEAWNGGPAHLPPMPHYFKVSGPGALGNLFCTGDIAGSTFNCVTPGYSVAVVSGRVKLSCSVTPTAGKVLIDIDVSKGGRTRRSQVPVSISMRAGTAPANVAMRNHCVISTPEPMAVSDSQVLSAVFIMQYLEDDGGNLFVAAGGADGRTQRFAVNGSIQLTRNSSGSYSFTSLATAGGNVASGTTSGLRKIDHGMHAMFVNVNVGSSIANLYLSAGHLISSGSAYAAETKALTLVAGTTLKLAGQPQSFGGSDYTFVNRAAAARLQYFNGVKGMIWMATGFVDFSVKANRDLFFNETTQTAVDLGAADGTVGGVSPFVYLPGDAAELTMGALYHNSETATFGGLNCRNHGSGGDMHFAGIGSLTTV